MSQERRGANRWFVLYLYFTTAFSSEHKEEMENSAQVCEVTWDFCGNTWSDAAVEHHCNLQY